MFWLACGASGAGISVTRLSVVNKVDAIEAEFCNAVLETLVGSIMPDFTISVYSLVRKLNP